MIVYLPSGYTPWEGSEYYGVFTVRSLAEEELALRKKENLHETYEITEVELNTPTYL